MIKANKNKYSITKMCLLLNIPRSVFYYKPKEKVVNSDLENAVIQCFKDSRNNYGTQKIKKELNKKGIIISRKKISKIMAKYSLISTYTIKQFKVQRNPVNEEKVKNVVNREFNAREDLEVLVSDLTYVRVNNKWHYICLIINLYNRKIEGFSAGAKKDADLVYKAFMNSKINLMEVEIFHTDRGSEFKNKTIDELLEVFHIQRSLSKKGCPYDNAVAEATYKVVKTEFAFDRIFNSLEELDRELFDYVNWYNTKRLHGSLGYVAPCDFRGSSSIKSCAEKG